MLRIRGRDLYASPNCSMGRVSLVNKQVSVDFAIKIGSLWSLCSVGGTGCGENSATLEAALTAATCQLTVRDIQSTQELAPMPATSLQYKLTTTSTGYRKLDQALFDMGYLQNALIRHRRSATGCHKKHFSLKLQNAALTDLHRNDPAYNKYGRRLLVSVAKRVNLAYAKAFTEPMAGFPQTSSPFRFSTLEVSEPHVSHLKVSDNGGTGMIHVKGLPLMKFSTDPRLPKSVQPRVFRITRTPRRWLLTLVFDQEPTEWSQPQLHSVGIDPGVKQVITTIDETGQFLQIPGFDDSEHRKVKRRLLRKTQRQRDAALQDGRARFISQRLRNGRTKSRFRWEGAPSRNYLKTISQLRRVEQKRADGHRGFQHRITTQLVRDYQTVCIENSKIQNMTRSARGSMEEPGTGVKQKSGLNRSILSQGWYGIRAKLQYKCQWHGRNFMAVPAKDTSRTCSSCSYTDPANRPSQAVFNCQKCGFTTNADVNAAENIRRQGLTLARAENSSTELPGRAAGRPKGQQAQWEGTGASAPEPRPALHA